MATLATHKSQRAVLGLKPIHWMMLGIIALALGGGGYSLSNGAMVAYASIPEARAQSRSVQVFGYLYSKGAYDEKGNWQFDIQGENGEVMTVVYPHTKPANFEQAISVVAIGRYDDAQQKFVADRLLVKCPSKYQEQVEERM